MERAALITGGSSGIGLAIARALGEDGYGLTISARRPEKLEAAAEALRSEGLEVLSVPANMTQEEEVIGAVAQHRERYGRLDVLVNNAGLGIGQPMDQIQTKHLDMQLDINLRALIIGTREALPMLREAGREHGRALIVNTASIAGKTGQGWLSVYAATKGAVVNFSQGTQKEGANDGIQGGLDDVDPGLAADPQRAGRLGRGGLGGAAGGADVLGEGDQRVGRER